MAAVPYIPTILLCAVAALCLYCPSSELLWIVGKALLLLVLLHGVAQEKQAEMANAQAGTERALRIPAL